MKIVLQNLTKKCVYPFDTAGFLLLGFALYEESDILKSMSEV